MPKKKSGSRLRDVADRMHADTPRGFAALPTHKPVKVKPFDEAAAVAELEAMWKRSPKKSGGPDTPTLLG